MDNFRGYATLLNKIKQRVLITQQRVIYAANEEMLRMYWDVGEMLQQSQDSDGWGKKTLQRLAMDLKNDYSEIKGFSVRNMQCMIQFFNEYNQELTMTKSNTALITQSVIAQLEKCKLTLPIKHLGWTHNLILLQQVKDISARYWYMVQSITSHWNTRYLQESIRLDDYGKHGALAHNFTETLPTPEANDVISMLKDPYINSKFFHDTIFMYPHLGYVTYYFKFLGVLAQYVEYIKEGYTYIPTILDFCKTISSKKIEGSTIKQVGFIDPEELACRTKKRLL